MKYIVLDSFKAQTAQGEITLEPGQVITLPKEMAISLLIDWKISPIERIAYKVYSKALDAFIWLVDDDEDRQGLLSQKVTEPVYTINDVSQLKKLPKEHLKAIQKIKTIFPMASIEEIQKGE